MQYMCQYFLAVVYSLEIHTPPERAYTRLWRSLLERDFFVFRAKACHDAHLALSEIPGNLEVRTYEIVIGGWGNMFTALRRGIGKYRLILVL